MHIHVFQHCDFEDEAFIGTWASQKGHKVSRTLLYAGQTPPPHTTYDMLVVMGGPMNIYEESGYPFLAMEKAYLKEAIAAGRKMLGICLGAQLLSDVLGGMVTRNTVKEIGFLPVCLTAEHPLLTGWPAEFLTFHWHGDTFSTPPEAVHIALSEHCDNQGFIYNNQVVALQFHPEMTPAALQGIINACEKEIRPTPTVQGAEAMLARAELLESGNALCAILLENLTADL